MELLEESLLKIGRMEDDEGAADPFTDILEAVGPLGSHVMDVPRATLPGDLALETS